MLSKFRGLISASSNLSPLLGLHPFKVRYPANEQEYLALTTKPLSEDAEFVIYLYEYMREVNSKPHWHVPLVTWQHLINEDKRGLLMLAFHMHWFDGQVAQTPEIAEYLDALTHDDNQEAIARAVHWFEAQAGNHPDLAHIAAELYMDGIGVDIDFDHALSLITPHAKAGVDRSIRLGVYCLTYHPHTPDIDSAIRWCLRGDILGVTRIQSTLGYLFQEFKNDPQQAITWYEKGVELDCAQSIYRLANLLLEDSEFQDLKQVEVLLRKGCDLGDPECMWALANFYEHSEPKDFAQAKTWYQNAIKHYNNDILSICDAMERLGCLYRNDNELEQAVSWFTQAAELDSAFSMRCLGYMYNAAPMLDQSKAREWFERGAALSDAACFHELGRLEEQPDGNPSLAVKHFQRAGELGAKKSYIDLGILYQYNEKLRDIEKAIECYHKSEIPEALYLSATAYLMTSPIRFDEAIAAATESIEAGVNVDKCQHCLGRIYHYRSDRPDLEQAIYWYEQAANNDYTNAFYELGKIYAHHEQFKDIDKAIYWLERLEAYGETAFYSKLAHCYGEKGDIHNQVAWLHKAAEADDRSAWCLLGRLYLYNSDVKDLDAACHWLTKAADDGNADAMYSMAGLHYCLGEKEKELEWLTKSANANHTYAIRKLASIYRKCSTDNDKENAVYWLEKAGETGDANAYYSLACLYYREDHRDAKEQIKWFGKGAAMGCDRCHHQLGWIYRFVEHCKNADKARHHIIEACRLGNKRAQRLLGDIKMKEFYDNSDASAKRDAMRAYQIAVDDGDIEAMYLLGHAYRYEPTQNIEKCKQYFTMAAEQGHEKSAEQLKQLALFVDAKTERLLAHLNEFMGIDAVKEEVANLSAMVKANEMRAKRGLSITAPRLNLVFAGNPGTGKTTVARKLGFIYKELGLIKRNHVVEVSNQDFFGNYDKGGWAEDNFKEVIERARGGILFIDEAYQLLARETSGKNIINLLLQTMENERDNLMVIVAGYPDEMKTFIESNVGLSSRFNKWIEFSDFTAAEMKSLFVQLARKRGSRLSRDAETTLSDYFEQVTAQRDRHFGNARFVENLIDSVQRQTDIRAIQSTGSIELIESIDIYRATNTGPRYDNHHKTAVATKSDPEAELESLIGLSAVKKSVKKLNAQIINEQRRKAKGLEQLASTSMHMVFTGSPGTGKTHVARLLAQILHSKGVIAKDTVVEVARQDLVAGYIGQTAIKTQEVIDKAMGGVLFIDEAYTLSKNEKGNDFGQEAIDVLLKEMEDKRDQFIVIVAGYEDDMQSFLLSNEGLKRRFKQFLHFDDFTGEELVQILQRLANKGGDTFTPALETALIELMTQWRTSYGQGFGNAGSIRNLYESLVEARSLRLMEMDDPSEEELSTFEQADWDEAVDGLSRF
uniref:AAA family ATPase n=1 Tax=Thaumasiovibrio occultus TaxID=1891184 RepID=UPI000B35BAB1|nr:AAA family ATPase [Thaumasiovibrio occultus]